MGFDDLVLQYKAPMLRYTLQIYGIMKSKSRGGGIIYEKNTSSIHWFHLAGILEVWLIMDYAIKICSPWHANGYAPFPIPGGKFLYFGLAGRG
jgi:hypothetical protein